MNVRVLRLLKFNYKGPLKANRRCTKIGQKDRHTGVKTYSISAQEGKIRTE